MSIAIRRSSSVCSRYPRDSAAATTALVPSGRSRLSAHRSQRRREALVRTRCWRWRAKRHALPWSSLQTATPTSSRRSAAVVKREEHGLNCMRLACAPDEEPQLVLRLDRFRYARCYSRSRYSAGSRTVSSLLGAPLAAWPARSTDACFLASFLACFRCRRSRSAASRLSLAIVVLFWEPAAIYIHPYSGISSAPKPRKRSHVGGREGDSPAAEVSGFLPATPVVVRSERVCCGDVP